MRYEGDIYRPPSEAYSLLVQVTIGCTHNKCTFCKMFKDKKFRVRKLDEILEDLAWARAKYRSVPRIFLCDGDALALSNNKLMPMHTNVTKKCVLRSNHASNYVSLRGDLPYDKEAMMNTLRVAMENKNMFKDERFRAL